jgi:hypothetical protein
VLVLAYTSQAGDSVSASVFDFETGAAVLTFPLEQTDKVDISAMAEEFYTPAEVAAMLKVSRDTVLRKFADYPGVIDLGSPESGRKRQYRTLRIPHHVFEKFCISNRVA